MWKQEDEKIPIAKKSMHVLHILDWKEQLSLSAVLTKKKEKCALNKHRL